MLKSKTTLSNKSCSAGRIGATGSCVTRDDVAEHIRDMLGDGERFMITPRFKEKADKHLPCYLLCGSRYYGLMFDRNGRVCFLLRMSLETATHCVKLRRTIMPADVAFGDDWYMLAVNGAFKEKSELFDLLDDCYEYTLNKFYAQEGIMRKADIKAEQALVEMQAADGIPVVIAGLIGAA